MAEVFSNQSQTTLNGSLTDTATSLIVASGTGFPAGGSFRVLIDSEIIIVGAISGTTFSSLTRGAEGTTASSHASGARVTHVLTAASLLAAISERIATHSAAGDPHPTYETAAEAQALVDTHANKTPDAHDASAVSFIPGSGVDSTNVQNAIVEVATELAANILNTKGRETRALNTNSGAAPTIDLNNGAVHDVTLTANATFTFTGAASGIANSFLLILRQDSTGGRSTTWPSSVRWPGGVAAPVTTSANNVNLLAFTSDDSGTTWFGRLVGAGFAPPPPSNSAPVVDAGAGQTVQFPTTVTLHATVSDDGLPNPPGTTTVQWTQVSGPGTASFTAPTNVTTNVSFDTPGVYTLRCTASDSVLTGSATVQVTETAATNLAPVVNAGPNQTVNFPTTVTLSGSVSDDGLPNPPGTTTKQWTKVSGPGTVTFAQPTNVNTTATFSLAGDYVLRLTASDSALSGFDDIGITQTAPTNAAPVVNAGMDRTVAFGGTVNLVGTVTDDGLPNPPGATTKLWSKVSGPGNVTFGTPTAAMTTATFSAAGTYVLRLTANDGALSGTDDVQVTMDPAPSGFSNVVSGAVNGFTVPAGQNWKIQGSVQSTANVVVNGTLTMRPGDGLTFTGINEASFVGGNPNGPNGETNMNPVTSDIGLWVTGAGVLDIVGTTKLTHTRLTTAVPAGSTTITLPEDPIGWQVGDEIVLPPSDAGYSNDSQGFGGQSGQDERTIAGISGRVITLSAATTYPHSLTTVKTGTTFGAEVLNLTRDVNIGGTSNGRSHVIIASTSKMAHLDYFRIRYVGPRDGSILGRYGLHFHHCLNSQTGLVTNGVVVTDAGFHAIVTHRSNNITHRRSITHRTGAAQYWWDPNTSSQGVPVSSFNESFGVTYDTCVASHRKFAQPGGDFNNRAAGFDISFGGGQSAPVRNVIKDCTAVGGGWAGIDDAGFIWPEVGGSDEWDFSGTNLSHNNAWHGMFAWENSGNEPRHPGGFFIYHNAKYGLIHGAYLNNYKWDNITFYRNAGDQTHAHLQLNAGSAFEPGNPSNAIPGGYLRFNNCVFDCGPDGAYCVITSEHRIASPVPTLFLNCTFKNPNLGQIIWKEFHSGPSNAADTLDFVNCTWEDVHNKGHFFMGQVVPAGARWRIQDTTHGTIQLTDTDPGGATFNSQYQAWVKSIPNFYPYTNDNPSANSRNPGIPN